MEINKKNQRKIIIVTDGKNWIIDPSSNSSLLEIKQICYEILEKYE